MLKEQYFEREEFGKYEFEIHNCFIKVWSGETNPLNSMSSLRLQINFTISLSEMIIDN
jgi:hypothetical protein